MVLCTRHDTPKDRGRLPAQQVTWMRVRTKRYRCYRNFLFDRWLQRFMNDEDSDSDEDEALSSVRGQLQRARRMLCRHHMSYPKYCRPRLVFALPKMTSPLAELDEYGFIMATRFTKGQFQEILTEMSRLPRHVRTPGISYVCTGIYTVPVWHCTVLVI